MALFWFCYVCRLLGAGAPRHGNVRPCLYYYVLSSPRFIVCHVLLFRLLVVLFQICLAWLLLVCLCFRYLCSLFGSGSPRHGNCLLFSDASITC